MQAADYEKLRHLEDFSLTALVKLSQLRRKVAEQGYEFFDLKEGETILLIEAARLGDNHETKELARQFLEQLSIHDQELRPRMPEQAKSLEFA